MSRRDKLTCPEDLLLLSREQTTQHAQRAGPVIAEMFWMAAWGSFLFSVLLSHAVKKKFRKAKLKDSLVLHLAMEEAQMKKVRKIGTQEKE